MARSYHLLKKITEEQAEEILNEIRDLELVKEASIDLEKELLSVDTAEDDYPEVMSRAVNICRRIGNGCDLSFSHFIYE